MEIPADREAFEQACRQLRRELATAFGKAHMQLSSIPERCLVDGSRYVAAIAATGRTLADIERDLAELVGVPERELVAACCGDLAVRRRDVELVAAALRCHETDLVRKGPAPSWLEPLGAAAVELAA